MVWIPIVKTLNSMLFAERIAANYNGYIIYNLHMVLDYIVAYQQKSKDVKKSKAIEHFHSLNESYPD